MRKTFAGRQEGTSRARIGLLTVGETARILGVSASTLRLWENVGLVSPARSNRGYRLYSCQLLDVLKRIKYLRDIERRNLLGIRQALGDSPAMDEQNGHSPTDRGQRLRRLRKQSGLSVTEAARRAKISAGFLSAIELSRENPSLATLQRLTALYGTTALDFCNLPKQFEQLVRRDERRAIETESGVRIEVLSDGPRLQSMLFQIAPGAGSGGPYSHQGEEFIFMLSGTLEIWLGELEGHTLREGDSLRFESTLGYRWSNPCDRDAVLLWINTCAC